MLLRPLFTSRVQFFLYNLTGRDLTTQPPWYKDHLAIKTTFAYSQRWTLYQGSTVPPIITLLLILEVFMSSPDLNILAVWVKQPRPAQSLGGH